ncbi:hypothetical protein JTE90_004986 [Oedothorax gibbosus]|uniref:Uncharacterized protein n=1 Tax=Oedothorax gibbosus TaxID=931172 RepID=A0AAV6VHN9_9ARAC|nr:hypothetical protein JTE90_004986 [Oedothorax gibbosus]
MWYVLPCDNVWYSTVIYHFPRCKCVPTHAFIGSMRFIIVGGGHPLLASRKAFFPKQQEHILGGKRHISNTL